MLSVLLECFAPGHVRRWLCLAALLVSALQCCAAELQEGRPAPVVRGQLLDGILFDSASERGKVIVLTFWASWCKPCREEMPALDAFYRAHRSEGLEILAVSVEGPEDMASITAAMKAYAFPAALADRVQARGYGRPWRLPMTFVIDRRGVLRLDGWKLAKALDTRALDEIVLPLLRQPYRLAHSAR